MKKFEVKYRQYGPMLDGGFHDYTETVVAKTARGAAGQVRRSAKEAFHGNPEYRIEILKVEEW